MGLNSPDKITDKEYRYDSFTNNKVLLNKKKNHLPAMGWNSWNAFGSGNTEFLTKAMADSIVSLGLDKLGYEFVILDDGCYKSERINGRLENDEVKFPSGFKHLSDYIHAKGLKFGMYNDIGTNLCAGAAVGTCGHEKTDAKSYVDWGVDFLKVDNCYFLWDNATFSNPENARFVYAPAIKSIIVKNKNFEKKYSAVEDGILTGCGGVKHSDYVMNIGTYDGTNTGTSPVGLRSSELQFKINVPEDGNYSIQVEYATGRENGTGCWLELGINFGDNLSIYYDDLLPETKSKDEFIISESIEVKMTAGENVLRLMNHRRQENTLCAYGVMLEGLNLANPDHNILLSICEWGKTQPANWGYKVGDSWRILNDITFRVGSDGDPGFGEWNNPGTQSVCSQYNKAVIMDEFAGLEKGWNDPDMLMIGMKGLSPVMNKSHFSMWCMMNSPLMLGMDLRRISVGDEFYKIIANKALIDINQDKLGIQAKRIWTSLESKDPGEYITGNNRSDILIKPLADGSFALAVFNLSDNLCSKEMNLDLSIIKTKMTNCSKEIFDSDNYTVLDLWTNESFKNSGSIKIPSLNPCDCIVLKITPIR